MSKAKFPITVKRGHTSVKIYRTPSRGCDLFTVVHYLGTKRQRSYFADLNLAMAAAETTATKLSEGEVRVLKLTGQDQLAYARAVQALEPTGIPLEMAAIHFAEAFKILNGASLLDAVRYYAKHHPSNQPKKTVSEVVAELIEAKEADGVSDVYLKDLRGRLGRFERAFPGQIEGVTTSEIESFLRNLKAVDRDGKPTGPLSGASRNNYRRAIGTLFYFAETKAYVVKGVVDIESLTIVKSQEGEITIYRPEEMARIKKAAKPELVPFLAIGAFAGLRSAEIERLDWSEVNLEDGIIEVKGSKAKTASRRIVPISENLKKWLLPHHQKHGAVCKYANVSKQLMWLAEDVDAAWKKEKEPSANNIAPCPPSAAGETGEPSGKESKRLFEWKHNALRHSFISYRVAMTQNVAQVALEAGNSPQMIFKHYRELVRPAAALAWFSIGLSDDERAKFTASQVKVA